MKTQAAHGSVVRAVRSTLDKEEVQDGGGAAEGRRTRWWRARCERDKEGVVLAVAGMMEMLSLGFAF